MTGHFSIRLLCNWILLLEDFQHHLDFEIFHLALVLRYVNVRQSLFVFNRSILDSYTWSRTDRAETFVGVGKRVEKIGHENGATVEKCRRIAQTMASRNCIVCKCLYSVVVIIDGIYA
jgi:hypothetical protein